VDESEQVLQQLPLTRWVGFGGGILMAGAGAYLGYAGSVLGWPWYVFGGLFVVAGLVMGFRAPGSRVELTAHDAHVRGLLWSRTVPRTAISSITPWPFIKWTDDRGRTHSTPVTMMNAAGALAPFARRAAENRRQLHQWAGVGGDYLHVDDEGDVSQ
jgi:hypothetical protein